MRNRSFSASAGEEEKNRRCFLVASSARASLCVSSNRGLVCVVAFRARAFLHLATELTLRAQPLSPCYFRYTLCARRAKGPVCPIDQTPVRFDRAQQQCRCRVISTRDSGVNERALMSETKLKGKREYTIIVTRHLACLHLFAAGICIACHAVSKVST